ncbi:uncharacterized protein F4822DRAFT_427855 [Hypoxylon trugodes]|uniref:uncharacterized protein n=1 Tax=Hypoxylon trugodes TaxID=326681 RepID=UPI002191A710|nr:uncharacterized protein F4822DRAFT_427855 [Hypoxylon trugodes]KAI1389506.1 hypothetical protein F4822DRAFT_427855 [Hypoxylon trugodes]
MELDPFIIVVFGPPPPTVNLAEDRTVGSYFAVGFLLSIAFVSVVLRIVARITARLGLMADDYFIIAALVFSIGTAAATVAGNIFGIGTHVWTISKSDLIPILKITYSYTIIYTVAILCIKLSLLCFYYRLFGMFGNFWRMSLFLGGFLTVGHTISAWISLAIMCRPISAIWDQYLGIVQAKCIDIKAAYISYASINIPLDILILVIPIPQILKLQMSMRKKLQICTLFSLGSFACIAGIARLFYLVKYTQEVDLAWTLSPVGIWSSVEPSIAILTACLPIIYPLFLRWGGKLRSVKSTEATEGYPSRRQEYRENRRLRRDDDEIALASFADGGPPERSDHTLPYGVVVQHSIKQSNSFQVGEAI